MPLDDTGSPEFPVIVERQADRQRQVLDRVIGYLRVRRRWTKLRSAKTHRDGTVARCLVGAIVNFCPDRSLRQSIYKRIHRQLPWYYRKSHRIYEDKLWCDIIMYNDSLFRLHWGVMRTLRRARASLDA